MIGCSSYSLRPRFKPTILAGTQRQLIEPHRKLHARRGDELDFFIEQPASHHRPARSIARATCAYVRAVRLDFQEDSVDFRDALLMFQPELDDFARDAGFEAWRDMSSFWIEELLHRGVFSGLLVRWENLRPLS